MMAVAVVLGVLGFLLLASPANCKLLLLPEITKLRVRVLDIANEHYYSPD